MKHSLAAAVDFAGEKPRDVGIDKACDGEREDYSRRAISRWRRSNRR